MENIRSHIYLAIGYKIEVVYNKIAEIQKKYTCNWKNTLKINININLL